MKQIAAAVRIGKDFWYLLGIIFYLEPVRDEALQNDLFPHSKPLLLPCIRH